MGTTYRAHLLGHGLGVPANVQDGPIGKTSPVHWVDRADLEEIGHLITSGIERAGQNVWHCQYGGPLTKW